MSLVDEFLSLKELVPVSLSSKEWSLEEAEKKTLAFFMAGVSDPRVLTINKLGVEGVAGGSMSREEARKFIRTHLRELGIEGNIQGGMTDIFSVRRQNIVIETNLRMAQGWADLKQISKNPLFPALRLYRRWDRKEKRDWISRWADAGGGTLPGTASNHKEMVALVGHPIWRRINVFGNDFAPFDWNSGMDLRAVDYEEAEKLGVISPKDEPDILEEELRSNVPTLNENLKSPDITGTQAINILSSILGPLMTVLPGGGVACSDPHGKRKASTTDLENMWRDELPYEIPQTQRDSLAEYAHKGEVSRESDKWVSLEYLTERLDAEEVNTTLYARSLEESEEITIMNPGAPFTELSQTRDEEFTIPVQVSRAKRIPLTNLYLLENGKKLIRGEGGIYTVE